MYLVTEVGQGDIESPFFLDHSDGGWEEGRERVEGYTSNGECKDHHA